MIQNSQVYNFKYEEKNFFFLKMAPLKRVAPGLSGPEWRVPPLRENQFLPLENF